MLEANSKVLSSDLKAMVNDAKALLHAATILTGEKAEAVHKRGMRLLNLALTKERESNELAAKQNLDILEEGDVFENIGIAIISAVVLGVMAGLVLGLNS